MDRKQHSILLDICDKFNLPYKNTFIQHRNLKEFKYFEIEKINPNHHIMVYGRLKNKSNKHNRSRKLINVGELLIAFTTVYLNLTIIYEYADFILLTLSMYIISSMFFYIFGKINLWRLSFDYWNRRVLRGWENCIHG